MHPKTAPKNLGIFSTWSDMCRGTVLTPMAPIAPMGLIPRTEFFQNWPQITVWTNCPHGQTSNP